MGPGKGRKQPSHDILITAKKKVREKSLRFWLIKLETMSKVNLMAQKVHEKDILRSTLHNKLFNDLACTLYVCLLR